MGIVRTQKNFFAGRLIGCTPESGLDCPDWRKIADAYGFQYEHIESTDGLNEKLEKFLNLPGYGLCEVKEDSLQGPAFKTMSKKLSDGEMVSAPLDELSPLLSEEEFKKYRYYRG
jgi:acetolactate synthase-1/2/3 large subunit